MLKTVKQRVFPDPVDDLSKRKSMWERLRLGVFIAGFAAALIGFAVYDSMNPITSLVHSNKAIQLDALMVYTAVGVHCANVTGIIQHASKDEQGSSTYTDTFDNTFDQDKDVPLSFKLFRGDFIITTNVMPDTFSDKTIIIEDACSDPNYGGTLILVPKGVSPADAVAGFEASAVHECPKAISYGYGMNTYIDVHRQDTVYENGRVQLAYIQNTRFSTQFIEGLSRAALLIRTEYVQYKFQTRAGLVKRILIDAGSTISAATSFSLIVLFLILRCRYSDPDAWVKHSLREDILVTIGSRERKSVNSVSVELGQTKDDNSNNA